MRGGRTTIYTDGVDRRWRVRELLRPDGSAGVSDRPPPVTQATLVFESRGERRFIDGAPLDWRDRRVILGELFARARPLQQSSGAAPHSDRSHVDPPKPQ